MKNWIVIRLINICCKKALKYELRKEMLLELKGFKYVYAVGINVYERDLWLRRIIKLQDWARK